MLKNMKSSLLVSLSVLMLFTTHYSEASDRISLSNMFLIVPSSHETTDVNFFIMEENEGIYQFDDFANRKDLSKLNIKKFDLRYKIVSESFSVYSGQLFFDGENIFYQTHDEEQDKIQIARVKRSKKSIELAVDNSKGAFDVYELAFERGVKLEAKSTINSTEAYIHYDLDITVRQRNIALEKELNKLRSQLQSNRGVSEDINIRKLQRQSPGLKSSINEFLDAIRQVLIEDFHGEAKEEYEVQVDKILQEFEKKLYRIAVNVDSLNTKSYLDSDAMSFIDLSETDQKRLNSEHVADRVLSLVRLFYLLTGEMENARKAGNSSEAEAVAGEALRTAAEIYLIAGKTKGSIGRKIAWSTLGSMLSGLALGLTAVSIEPLLTQLSLGIPAVGLVASSAISSIKRDKNYKDPKFVFPFISRWDRRKSAKSTRALTLPNFFDLGLPIELSFNQDGSPWIDYRNNSYQENSGKKMMRIISLASGRKLTHVLKTPSCDSSFETMN